MLGEKLINENRAYSVRLSGSDLRKLKAISERLRVNESDIIRFSLRHVLAKLSPLHDHHQRGASLLPVFVEFGDELATYFDLDESALESILNDGLEDARRVDREDIGLLLTAGMENTRLFARLADLVDGRIDPTTVQEDFRRYIYEKYLYGDSA